MALSGPGLNVPIATNRHVQNGPFWRGVEIYSKGLPWDQQGLHGEFPVGRLNLVYSNGVLLSTFQPPPKGLVLNMPIAPNRHVQNRTFWPRVRVYSKGPQQDQQGLHPSASMGWLSLDYSPEVLLSTP